MDCKKCGTPLVENDQFCKNCGAPVNGESAQTNYGPAPTKNTLKVVLIFLGIAILVAAIIIAVAIFFGNKDEEDDDDVKTSKKKTEVVTTDDEDKEEEQEEEKEEEEIAERPTTKSTYTVKSNGFTFKIPTDLIYETVNSGEVESIAVGDEEQTWIATIATFQGSYNQLLTNKSQLQSEMLRQGCTTASAAIEKNIDGKSFVVLEAAMSGQNVLFAYAKANSMYVFSISVMNINNEFDYDVLETVAEILNTAEFNTETTNMELPKELDLSVISELAQE